MYHKNVKKKKTRKNIKKIFRTIKLDKNTWQTRFPLLTPMRAIMELQCNYALSIYKMKRETDTETECSHSEVQSLKAPKTKLGPARATILDCSSDLP